MSAMIYKGYTAMVERDPDVGLFAGRVLIVRT